MHPSEVLWLLEEFEQQKLTEDYGGMSPEDVEYLYNLNYGANDE